jgi:acyl-CoA hydrolase
MSYESKYKSKLITVDVALSMIKSGDKIVTGFGAGEAQSFLGKLHEIRAQVENVGVWMSMTFPKYEFFSNPEMAGHFEANSWFHGPGSRAALGSGLVSSVPAHLHNGIRRTFEVERPNIFVGCCPPIDRQGFVKMSLSVIYERLACEKCKTIIMEVNPNMPDVWGDTEVSIDNVDYYIETDRPLSIIPPPPINEKDMMIGRNAASLVNDGDTIQLGIGSIPNAVAICFMEKKDLGVHTEMISASIVDLVEAGVINGKRKTLYPGKIVGTFILGDQKLYDFVDNNPSILLLRGEYVNNPSVVAQNDNMVSINTAIQVDLSGQVYSESIGSRMWSGSGGANDTAEGAIHAKNGRSIICLYSTAKDDTVSTITPSAYPGAVVSLSRNNVDYIVTEYGIAPMKGLSIRKRAQNLIAVSHPKFRDELEKAVKDNQII